MESNSMAPALEMNGKEKEMVHQKKWAFNLFLKLFSVGMQNELKVGALIPVKNLWSRKSDCRWQGRGEVQQLQF